MGEAGGQPSPLERVQLKLAAARAARERRLRGDGEEEGAAPEGGRGMRAGLEWDSTFSRGGSALSQEGSSAASATSARGESGAREFQHSPPAGLARQQPPAAVRVDLQGSSFGWGGASVSSERSSSGAWATTSEGYSGVFVEEAAPWRQQGKPRPAPRAADRRPAWNSSVTVKEQRVVGFQPIGGVLKGGGGGPGSRNCASGGEGFRNVDVSAGRQRRALASQLKEVNAVASSNRASATKLFREVGVAHSTSFGGRDLKTIKKARSGLEKRAQYSPERSRSSAERRSQGSPLKGLSGGGTATSAAGGERTTRDARAGLGSDESRATGGDGRGNQLLPLRTGGLDTNSHVIRLKIPSVVDDRLSSPKGAEREQERRGLQTAAKGSTAATHVHLSLSNVMEPNRDVGGSGPPMPPDSGSRRSPREGYATPSHMVFQEWTPQQERHLVASVTADTGSQTDFSCLRAITAQGSARSGPGSSSAPSGDTARPLSKHISSLRSPKHAEQDGVPEGLATGNVELARAVSPQLERKASWGDMDARGGSSAANIAKKDLQSYSRSPSAEGEADVLSTVDVVQVENAPRAGGPGQEAEVLLPQEAGWDLETDDTGRAFTLAFPRITKWSAEGLLNVLGKGARMHKNVQWCGGAGSWRNVKMLLRDGHPFLEWETRKKTRCVSSGDPGQAYSCRVEAFAFEAGMPWTRQHTVTVVCSFGDLRLRPASAALYVQWVFGLNLGLWAADLSPEEVDLSAVPAVVEWHAEACAR